MELSCKDLPDMFALFLLKRMRILCKAHSQFIILQVKCMKAAQEEQGPMRSQVLYNFGLCLWLLSYDDNGMEELKRPAAVVPLVNLLKEGMLTPTSSHAPARACSLHRSQHLLPSPTFCALVRCTGLRVAGLCKVHSVLPPAVAIRRA